MLTVLFVSNNVLEPQRTSLRENENWKQTSKRGFDAQPFPPLFFELGLQDSRSQDIPIWFSDLRTPLLLLSLTPDSQSSMKDISAAPVQASC